ncbi:hypothetical protein CBR_g30664 [Chara braunii]|uniref:Reverse transcriptase domain-containing protein n=1 Tax=Chara braunii TaxID=69332 RepID=A0A388LDE5_CHABU|nr:hypothetical protein CBR_g30664 [Chara braunii]|eukprot:GBG80297.1 hypothetical protein CBR_g30664 [Chara braunii]
MKVAAEAGEDWAKFKAEMQRRFKLGDGLLTKTNLEMLQRDKFSTVGAFATTFEKMAKKVPGLAEEEQCATFLGHFKNWEASSLTKKAAPGKKITWAAIKEGVIEGELDQVDIFQMRQARKKRKALDASTSDGRDFKRMVEDAVAQLDAEKEARATRKAMAAPQTHGKAKKAVVQEEEEEEEEEPEPQKLTKAQRKAKNLAQGGQGSRRGQTPQATALPPPESHEIPGGSRKEALRRVEAGEPPAPPAMFRIWQEEEVRPDVRVEEIGENEEVEQERKVGTVKEEPIAVETDEEIKKGYWNDARRTMERMEDLVAKLGRYQDKLTNMCEEVKEWKGKKPLVYLYDMGPGPQGGSGSLPGVTISGPTPRSGLAHRPPSRSGGAPQVVRTRAKGPVSPNEPAKDVPKPSREKQTVDIPENEDERDERLRREEDKRVELRAKKRDVKADADRVPEGKKRKYVVRVEEGYDVEEMMDRLLEGHNHFMNLKDVLASAPRLRDELKARLSRKMVASVRLGVIIPKEAEWAETGTKMDWESIACRYVDVVVKGKTCTTMVDTAAEMNLIKEEHALRLGMEIDRSDNGVLMGVNSRSVFIATASRVVLEIGKVKVRSCFFVMTDLDHPILLGRSFLSRTETVILNKHDGTMFLVLCDPICGNYEVITRRNTGPRSIRNRPNLDSFTIEESEEERKRLGGDEFEEERNPEALTLNLTNIGDTMDIVSTYGMTVPEAVEALREKVMEQMGEGEVELVYRTPGKRGGSAGAQPLMRDAGGLPNADALLEACAGRSIISLIDLYSGYDQFPVYPSDKTMTAMHTPRGLIHMNAAPQGWTNAVAMLQRHMVRAMQPVSPHITQPYIDDLAVKGPKEKNEQEVMPEIRRFVWDHVQDLCKVLDLLKEHNLTESGTKSRHCMRGATILGFACDERGRRPNTKKTNKILEWPTPFETITEVRSFLGTCGFFRVFIKGFAAKTEQLRKLVRQGLTPFWGSHAKREGKGRASGNPSGGDQTDGADEGQEQSEEQAAREKEQDRKERAAIEREIRVQIRLKNIAELHEKVEQGEQSVILEDRKGNDSPTQDDETPLFTEAWDNFDKLLEAEGRPREQHQEMGVKLASTDLLSLEGLMKEGFVAAKTSDEKMEKRLTRMARASHEQRMDWQKEIDDLKKELESQTRKWRP